jgi:hypothetical protein
MSRDFSLSALRFLSKERFGQSMMFLVNVIA